MAAAFPSWTAFLTPGILIISTSVAVAAILFARRTARQKATLDLIERVEATEYYRDLRTAFSSHRQANSLSRLHKPVTYADKLDRQKIQDFLNHHEIISIAILNGVLDRKMYYSWMAGPFIRDWNAAAMDIQTERWRADKDSPSGFRYHSALYSAFQRVAHSMSDEAIFIAESSGGLPETPDGPGNDPLPRVERDYLPKSASWWHRLRRRG